MNSLKKRSIDFLDLVPKSQIRELETSFKKVLSSGNYILGKEVEDFEKAFAKYLGAKFCIGVGNGLEALQISLMALGIDRGDEVITSPITAAATTLAILAVGAKPVFVDTTSNGLINLDLIQEKITKKTKAILPVHLYGNSPDMKILQNICKKNKLFLIEDAAQAHGSSFKGKKLGTFGTLGCLSFYPTKNLGGFGDGGAIVTNNKRLAEICRQIRDYGQDGKYKHVRYGLNSRLDELQAALLMVRLKTLEHDNRKRRQLAKRYIKNFYQLKEIEIIKSDQNSNSNFHLFVIKTKARKKLANYLKNLGIQTLIHYPQIIPDQLFFKKQYGNLLLPNAREFVKTCLSLPLSPKLSFSDIDYVSSKINRFFE